MKDPRKDAVGVKAAYEFIADKYDLMSNHRIKKVCVAVINRYDQTKAGANMTTIALSTMETDCTVFRVSNLKRLCEYLTKN